MLLFGSCCTAVDFEAFRDDILFQINWPGSQKIDVKSLAAPGIEYNVENSFEVRSANNERYRCTVPSLTDNDHSKSEEESDSKSISQLLAPVFKSGTCTYIVESYWTYELCHGKHIRQYHEERVRKSTGKKSETHVLKKGKDGKLFLEPQSDSEQELIKTTEYFLGYFHHKINDEGVLLDVEKFPSSAEQVTKKKINGLKTPYFAINMTDGTACDLKV